MSKHIINVPAQLWQNDLPPGYSCTMYVGRMSGALKQQNRIVSFVFEIVDPEDPTEMAVRYTTFGAPAQELARWENVGDTVGIVIAHSGKKMDMMLAYNFTRRKWFGTDYYPHLQDKHIGAKIDLDQARMLVPLGIMSFFVCGLGVLILPFAFYVLGYKDKQYGALNPMNFRGATSKKIADWITSDSGALAEGGNPSLDPSL